MGFAALFLLGLLSAVRSVDSPSDEDLRRACSASDGAPAITGILTRDFPAAPNDLPGIRVIHEASGGWMNVYYSAEAEAAARSRAACLGAQIPMLMAALGDDRRDTQWFSAVFAEEDYVSPRDGTDTRWLIQTSEGKLTNKGEEWAVYGMPHEQTHAFQGRNESQSPRWFHEGHASWIGAAISARLNPAVAQARKESNQRLIAAAPSSLKLGQWGGMIVTQEAIRRQVTPEVRARMDRDPTFVPPGPFSFQPGDLVSDETNTEARYVAAERLFEALAERHGAEAVNAWVRDVTATDGRLSTPDLTASAQARFGEDITPYLR